MSVRIAMLNDGSGNFWHKIEEETDKTLTTACGEEFPRAVAADIRTVEYFKDVGPGKSPLDQKLDTDGRCEECGQAH